VTASEDLAHPAPPVDRNRCSWTVLALEATSGRRGGAQARVGDRELAIDASAVTAPREPGACRVDVAHVTAMRVVDGIVGGRADRVVPDYRDRFEL